MKFYDYTAASLGGHYSRRVHDSTALFRGGVDVFAGMFEDARQGINNSAQDRGSIHLKWTASPFGSSAVGIFFSIGMPAVCTLFLSGQDQTEEQETIGAFEELVRHISPDGLSEAFTIPTSTQRPTLVSVPLPFSTPHALRLVEEMETCLAAAFFESLAKQSRPGMSLGTIRRGE